MGSIQMYGGCMNIGGIWIPPKSDTPMTASKVVETSYSEFTIC